MGDNQRQWPGPNDITHANKGDDPGWMTWSGDTVPIEVLIKSTEALAQYRGANRDINGRRPGERSVASILGRDFSNLAPNVSGRPGLTRSDYEAFRPDEGVPKTYPEIFYCVNTAYKKVGLIRNITDLKADFTAQGVMPVHPDPRKQRFVRKWWKKINGYDRTERFCNYLYRFNNVFPRRITAKVTETIVKKWYKTKGEADVIAETTKQNRREIPWRYAFIDPSVVVPSAGDLSAFIGKHSYAIKIPDSLRRMIMSPKTDEEKAAVLQLPVDIIEAAKSTKPYFVPDGKLGAYFYKKDDWEAFACPMLLAVMDDVFAVEKMKLADIAALDGAISNIRIFKLGSMEHKIRPTQAAIAKLGGILDNHTGGGSLDIIWDAAIEMQESGSSVHQFLGLAKYVPHLNAIHAGLGVPQTLTASSGDSGTTNNFISLKTLMEQLSYGRAVVTKFWEDEFEILRQAMDWDVAPTLEFKHSNLTDDSSERALWFQAYDRGIFSDETMRIMFGKDPEFEALRIKREEKLRKEGKLPPKAGPFTSDSTIDNDLKKIALQGGSVAPSQVGLELEEKKAGEKTQIEAQPKPVPAAPGSPGAKKPKKKPGVSGQGRPKNSTDKTKRKTKRFTPKQKAAELWATAAQRDISSLLNAFVLAHFGKKNMRSLTDTELETVEALKFGVLFQVEPFSEITETSVLSAIGSEVPVETKAVYTAECESIGKSLARKLTLEEQHRIQTYIYASTKVAEDDSTL